jgi:uncharacterized membrane protein
MDDTIVAIERLLESPHGAATTSERFAKAATSAASRPFFLGLLSFAIAVWILLNIFLSRVGWAFDAPPFSLLQTILSVGSLIFVVMVLGAQRREDILDEKMRYLNLQLALINEQKTAKIIGLLEEMRRDSPHIPDRVDEEANAMASPVDPILAMQERSQTSEK